MASQSCSVEVENLIAEESFIRTIARGLLFDGHEVDDVVQQAWLRTLEKPPSSVQSSRGYLGSLTRSLASNHRRSSARRREREERSGKLAQLPTPEELLAHQETRTQVAKAVSSLPEKYRSVVLLRYYEGLPPRRIATELGVGRDTVATRLKRGLKRLREILDSECGGRRAWCLALVPLARPTPLMAAGLLAQIGAVFGVLTTMKTLIALSLGILALVLYQSGGDDPRDLLIGNDDRGVQRQASHDGTPRSGTTERIAARPFTEEAETAAEEDVDTVLARELGGFRGRLVDESGAPLAGELVKLFSVDTTTSMGGAADLFSGGAAGLKGGSARSDAKGEFLVRGIWPGSVHALHAGVGGERPLFRILPSSPGPRQIVDLGDVVLERSASLEGVVLAPDGEPLPGARVWAVDLPKIVFSVAPLERLDPEGALLLSLPKVGAETLSKPGEYQGALRSHLMRTIIRAKDDAGFVTLEFPKWAREFLSELPRREAISGPDGRFVVHGLAEGELCVVVSHPKHSTSRRDATLRRGERTQMGKVRLREGRRFHGTIVDDEGKPCAGVEVRAALRPAAGLSGMLFAQKTLRSDAEGKFRVDGLPRGRVQLAIRRSAGEPWFSRGPFRSNGKETITLPATRDQLLLLRSKGGAPLEGIEVSLRQGPPLGELTLSGLAPQIALGERLAIEANEEEVQLRFSGLTPGLYTVFVRAKGHEPGCHLLQVEAGAPERPRLELLPAWTTRCVVVDEKGAPVHGARLFVQRAGESTWSRSMLYTYGGIKSWKSLARSLGRTDARGELVVEGLPLSGGTLRVDHPRFGLHAVELGEATERLEIALPTPGSLEGRLFDEGAVASSEKWRVSIEPCKTGEGPRIKRFAALDGEGNFLFEALPPGEYTLKCERALSPNLSLGTFLRGFASFGWGSSYRTRDVLIRSGERSELSFDTDRERRPPGSMGSVVRGELRVDGVPAVGWRAESSRVSGGAVLDDQGRFELRGIAEGRSRLRLVPPRDGSSKLFGVILRRELLLGTDEELRMDVAIQCGVLSGRLLGGDGIPASRHQLSLNGSCGKGWEYRRIVVTGEDGSFRVDLPIGSGKITVSGPQGLGTYDYRVASGSPEELRLQLDSRGTFAGVLEPAQPGKLPMFLRLRMKAEANGIPFSFIVNVDPDGRFYSGKVPVGDYELHADKPEGGSFKLTPDLISIPAEGLHGQRIAIR